METPTVTEEFTPPATLRALGSAMDVYKRVFVGPPAPLFSRPNPVRRTGFDLDVVVERRRLEAADVVSLTLRPLDGAQLPTWTPGSHIDVFLPSGKQRQYSLCGDPADLRRYRIAVRRLTGGGGGSREIHDALTTGDTVRIRGPRNAFSFVAASSYFFIAGGIGITPILPMVKAASAAGVPWKLIYLGRSRTTMPFLDELRGLTGGELDIRPDDELGAPDAERLISRVEAGAAMYVCGPPAVLDAAQRTAFKANPTGSLHTERFSALPVLDGTAFDVMLARSGTTVRVGATETALTAIRRQLPGAAYSCQQGFCGTCKVRVLSGRVDHRDRVLTEAERESHMLTCVSRAAGDTLELDL